MKPFKKQQFQDYFYIFLGGFLGFLISLFFLHFVHNIALGRSSEIDLISFFGDTTAHQIEALGIILSFSFLGIVSGIVRVFRQKIRKKKESIKLLEKVSQAKTEFISLASHQLRTPLTAIKWSFKMMLDGDFGKLNNQQRKILLRDTEANERLIILVKDLLDISRIEQQRFEIHLKSVPLSHFKQIIEKIVSELIVQAERKNISLDLDIPFLSENQVLIDSDKITQIIQNLLENAVDYTSPGGRIQVKTEEKHNNLLIHISDTGIGIPKTEQEKIFTKFFRARNAREIRSGGAGLGLYLGKTFIEMQEGKIWFTSQEGKGTTFSFSLPLRGRVPAEEFLRRL